MVETQRLVLRPIQDDDAEDLCPLWGDPEVMRFIGDSRPRTRAEAEERLRRAVRHWQEHGFGLWALHDKATGSFVGGCGVGYFNGLADVEVGYALARPYWGSGLASEAVARVLRHAFDVLQLSRLVALVRAENVASLRSCARRGWSARGHTSLKAGSTCFTPSKRPHAARPPGKAREQGGPRCGAVRDGAPLRLLVARLWRPAGPAAALRRGRRPFRFCLHVWGSRTM